MSHQKEIFKGTIYVNASILQLWGNFMLFAFALIFFNQILAVWLVGWFFYGISIIVGYLMPNSLFAYIKPYFSKRINSDLM